MLDTTHLNFFSFILPVLLTALLLPSSIAPSFFNKMIFLSLIFWLLREIRLSVREFLIGRRAQASGGRLAPKVHSSLPFGLSVIRQRIQTIATGTPDMVLEPFKDFPEGTQVIRTRCFGIETLMTRSHLDAKHAFTSGFSKWGKSPSLKAAFKPFLGGGMFSSDQRGLWSWHRALARPHFSRDRINVDAAVEHADRIISWLEEKSQTHQAVNIQDVFSRFTLTVGTQHLFGNCVDLLNELLKDRPMKPGENNGARFSHAFEDSQEQCLKLLQLPPFLVRLVHAIMPSKSFEVVFELIDELVAKRKSHHLIEENSGREEMVEKESEHFIEHLYRSGASKDIIREQSLNILLAARDTTSSTLTSCIYELSGKLELWTQLRDEVSLNSGFSSIVTFEDIRKLKLLRAVINETLRLHPPVWCNFRHAFEDDVLPSGIFVPAGSDCTFHVRDFHRDPKLWGDDAEVFLPDRWMDEGRRGGQVGLNQDHFIFQPFALGPRTCLGQQMAYTEVSVVLIKLLKAFSSLELVGKREDVEEVPGLLLSIRGGLWVKFQK